MAEKLLREKRLSSVGAVVGAYVLLRLGETERLHDWTSNLFNLFALPDPAVIYAEHLARRIATPLVRRCWRASGEIGRDRSPRELRHHRRKAARSGRECTRAARCRRRCPQRCGGAQSGRTNAWTRYIA